MNIEAIDHYLSMGQSQEEKILRRNLAMEGPSLIEPVIQRTLLKLRSSRHNLDDFFAGRWAAMAIKQSFERAGDLIFEIINATPQGGNAVAQELLFLSEHQDAGMRAMAAVFLGLQGIPPHMVDESLRKRFQTDDDLVVKMATAVHLQGNIERFATLSVEEQKSTRRFVTAYAEMVQQEPGSSRIHDDDIFENVEEDSQSERVLMMGVFYAMQLLGEIPIMIALQGEEY